LLFFEALLAAPLGFAAAFFFAFFFVMAQC
jgi:hypothetical protein